MVAAGTFKTIGQWDKQIGVPLRDALAVSMDIMGRTGEEACKHAIILMAQSAKAITEKAKSRREVLKDARLHGAEYVNVYLQNKPEPSRVHRFRFSSLLRKQDRMPGTWDNARKIGNRGLAQRSWMWGLGKLGATGTGSPIRGTSDVFTIIRGNTCGYIKQNKLSYILKAMPSGWESSVERSAGNKIMAQARMKLENQWRREMNLPRRVRGEPGPDAAFLARYFQS